MNRARRQPSPAGRRRRTGASGFTLIEIVVSAAIMTIIMGAMMSVMLIASRAVNTADGANERTARARDVVDQITADLSLAEEFTERTDRAVAFTVPDRDADEQLETIRYAWSGVAGDPLTRQYNGGTEVTVAENVHRFNLAWMLKTVAPSE